MPSFPVPVADGANGTDPNAVTLWTGTEVVVPGLFLTADHLLGASPAFDPATRRWRVIAAPPVDMGVSPTGVVAVWSGTEMLMFDAAPPRPGSEGGQGPTVGAAYRPATNTWRRLAAMPPGRQMDFGVWTGDRLLGYAPGVGVSQYDPSTDTWLALTTESGLQSIQPGATPTPRASSGQQAVWDGSALVVADGYSHRLFAFAASGSAWTAMPESPFDVTTLAWKGDALVGFDGDTGALATLRPGGSWERRAGGPFTHHGDGSTARWAAGHFVVWGGLDFDYTPGSAPPRPGLGGAAWGPSSDTWTPVASPPGITTTPGDAVLGGVAAGERLLSWGLTRSAGGSRQLVVAAWAPP